MNPDLNGIDFDGLEDEIINGPRVNPFETAFREFRDIRILGKPLHELAAGVAVGGLVKDLTRTALIGSGVQGWILAIAAGTVAGAAMGAGRSLAPQVIEGWKKDLDPALVNRREQLMAKFSNSFDNVKWGTVGKAAFQGAIKGAVGGIAGAALSEVVHQAIDHFFTTSGVGSVVISPPANEVSLPPDLEGHLPPPHAVEIPIDDPAAVPGENPMEGVSTPPVADTTPPVPGENTLTNPVASVTPPASEIPHQDLTSADAETHDVGSSINHGNDFIRPPETAHFTPTNPHIPPVEVPHIPEPNFHVQVHIDHPGDTFWGSFNTEQMLQANHIDNWTNPLNGVTKADVVKDLVIKFAEANGHNVDMVHVGDVYNVDELLTPEQVEVVKQAMATTDHNDYWTKIRPAAQRLM